MKNKKNYILGVQNRNYALKRKKKYSWKYRLNRRTKEVIQAINKYHSETIDSILDIGTAEGAMLSEVKKHFPSAECVGLEYSRELIKMNKDKNIKIIQGDAQKLPFKNESFDIVIAAAVIEHLSRPFKLLTESHRVLRKGGTLILTTPDPFFDNIADILTKQKGFHQKKFNLKELKKNLEEAKFQILHTKKFMLSPFGFPLELMIEKMMRSLKLDFILLNQLIVGRKL